MFCLGDNSEVDSDHSDPSKNATSTSEIQSSALSNPMPTASSSPAIPPPTPLATPSTSTAGNFSGYSSESENVSCATVRTRGRKPLRTSRENQSQSLPSSPEPATKRRKCRPVRSPTTVTPRIKKRARGIQLEWKSTEQKRKTAFRFRNVAGVNINIADADNILSVFKTFLSDKMIDDFVKFTNDYADMILQTPAIQAKISKSKRSLFKLWTPTDRDELWMYIAITLLMGVIDKPEHKLFWSRDPLFETPIFHRLMRRERFRTLHTMVHFSNPVDFNKEDPLNKLRYFLDELSKSFLANYTPEQNVAIDEYLSLWKGRLSFRVYIPSKRERYGVKLFMLCESSTGYLSKFIVYTGATTDYGDFDERLLPSSTDGRNLPSTFDDYKSPSKVVLCLMKPFINMGYRLTLDNYYTSPELAIALLGLQTDCYGTLRKKEGLPKDFWSWKPQKGDPPKKNFCNDMMVLRWNDESKTKSTKFVSMLSTIHSGDLVDSGKKNRLTGAPVNKPNVIVDYNQTMGGVDTLSRVLIPYSTQRRGIKWYRKLAELFVDICVYNAFISWKKLNPTQGKMDHLNFRKNLISDIITHHCQGQKDSQTGRKNAGQNPLRLIERHFISIYPSTRKKSSPQISCVRCRARGIRKDTRYMCIDCGVGLCLEKCFRAYHTLQDYTVNSDDNQDSE